MAYKALYRTYRPTTFEEVAGQEHIVKTLKNALATNKIAHAYLFCGPRGTGKTTMAKLLAKALNCSEGLGHQCNHCENCIAINEGTHPDVIEIDAASNNGVEEVRDLIDKVKYGTILGKYKVYIIDEVHMMSTGAFNALLKTLEEPPEHVIFILATTEPNKILPTILSRCQRYDFTKLSDEEIRKRLKEVLQKENIPYNEEAINLIISLSDGGMRDALSILDQVLAYSNNVLNPKDILDIFSIESKEEKIKLLKAIGQNNLSEVLLLFNKYVEKGTDIKRLSNDLLQILKDYLISENTIDSTLLTVLKKEDCRELSNFLNSKKAIQMIDILMDTIKDFKNVSSINTLFEVSLLKLCDLNKNHVDKESKQINDVEEKALYSNKLIEKDEFNKKQPSSQPNENEIEIEKIPQDKKSIIEEKIDKQKEEKKINKDKEKAREEESISLFDDDLINFKPKLNNKMVLFKSNQIKDDHYHIDDNLLVDIMVISKKDIKNDLLNKWGLLKKFQANPLLGKAATLLADGRPLVASKNILILEYQSPTIVDKVNATEMQNSLQDVIINAFDKKMFVYALSRIESIKFQNLYMNLLQLNKLPKTDTINIELIGDK